MSSQPRSRRRMVTEPTTETACRYVVRRALIALLLIAVCSCSNGSDDLATVTSPTNAVRPPTSDAQPSTTTTLSPSRSWTASRTFPDRSPLIAPAHRHTLDREEFWLR